MRDTFNDFGGFDRHPKMVVMRFRKIGSPRSRVAVGHGQSVMMAREDAARKLRESPQDIAKVEEKNEQRESTEQRVPVEVGAA